MSTKKERQGRAVEGEGNVFPIAAPPFDVGAPRIWITHDDELVFNYRTHEATIDVTHTLRILRLDGSVDHIEERVTLTASSNVASHVIQLGDGWLVGVKISHNGNVIRGRIWAFFELRYGLTGGTFSGVQLAAGYLTNISRVSWPHSGLPSSLDGPGELAVITVSDPAAGSDFSQTVPTLQRWRMRAVRYKLSTDANAATRGVFLSCETAGGDILASIISNQQIASRVDRHHFVGGVGTLSDLNQQSMAPLWDILLREGDVVRSFVGGIQVGDQLSEIVLTVERWFEEQS